MSDYLNNLVARTQGNAPKVHPRLAARFEPALPGVRLSWGSAEGPVSPLETEVTALTVAPSSTPSPAERLPEPTLSSPRPVSPLAEPPRQARTPSPTPPPEASPVLRPAAPREPLAPIPAPVSTVRLERQRGLQEVALHPVEVPVVSEAVAVPPRRRLHQAEQPSPQNSVLPSRERQETERVTTRVEHLLEVRESREASRPQPFPPVARADTATEGITITPRVRAMELPLAPKVESRTPLNEMSAPVTPTTIQVTIGRIEVRATPTQPVARPATNTAPIMSLDAYLRQRAGEKR